MSRTGETRGAAAASPGVLRFVAAGSVDDGKSTLIGRLLHDTRAILEDQLAALARASRRRGLASLDLSLVTDGLEAEREQGITIDVAYRYFATARRKFIVADAPGHEQYTRNMVTGASTADAAVILADACKGLLPQTRRHLLIARLLGIRHVIVAVNKMDAAQWSEDAFAAVRRDFERFAAPLAVPDLRFVPVSALAGDMVVERGARLGWHPGPTLLEALEAIDVVDERAAQPFRFPVQGTVRGGRRGYTGRVASGAVRAGDEVIALPSGLRAAVTEIATLDGARPAALAGDSVTLRLDRDLDLARGDMLAAVCRPPRAARSLEARLCWLAREPLAAPGRYLLRHTTRTVGVALKSVNRRLDIHTLEERRGGGEVRANDIVDVSLLARQPVFAEPYAENRATGAFILVDEATHQTVAAGMFGRERDPRHNGGASPARRTAARERTPR